MFTACQSPNPGDKQSAETQVRAVLAQQAREWNAGNLAGFMDTYARGEQTRFASGGNVSRGWQTVFDRYRKNYSSRAAMGTLDFADLEVTMLAPDSAVAFGRWHLKREQDDPSGLFTLILQRQANGWRIIYDHTSAAAAK